MLKQISITVCPPGHQLKTISHFFWNQFHGQSANLIAAESNEKLFPKESERKLERENQDNWPAKQKESKLPPKLKKPFFSDWTELALSLASSGMSSSSNCSLAPFFAAMFVWVSGFFHYHPPPHYCPLQWENHSNRVLFTSTQPHTQMHSWKKSMFFFQRKNCVKIH